MNINELYENIPVDQHGNIAVSADAVTITQGKKAAIFLLKKTSDDNADLTDTSGKTMDRAALEKTSLTLKSVAQIAAEKIKSDG